VTVTVTEAGVEVPPLPVAVAVYVVVAVSGGVWYVPLGPWGGTAGVIVTEVASVEVHVRVAVCPATMDCGDTLSETVGGPLFSVSEPGAVLLLLPVLLLPPLPHALKKSVTPTRTTSNIEDFCRTMGPT
jgi:hypothetical protein